MFPRLRKVSLVTFGAGLLLLGVAAIMFRPGFFAHYVGIDNHYLSYLVGLALYVGVMALQKLRGGKTPSAA